MESGSNARFAVWLCICLTHRPGQLIGVILLEGSEPFADNLSKGSVNDGAKANTVSWQAKPRLQLRNQGLKSILLTNNLTILTINHPRGFPRSIITAKRANSVLIFTKAKSHE